MGDTSSDNKKKRILLVDDEIDLAVSLQLWLESHGYEVSISNDGSSALDAYRNAANTDQPFQMILLDIMMPKISGLDVLESLRKDETEKGVDRDKGIPVIMLTALQHSFMQAFELGCTDYLVKPFNNQVLLEKIQSKIGAA